MNTYDGEKKNEFKDHINNSETTPWERYIWGKKGRGGTIVLLTQPVHFFFFFVIKTDWTVLCSPLHVK